MKKCSWIVLGRSGDIPLVTCLAVSSRSQSESDLNHGDLPVRLRQAAEGAEITSRILISNDRLV